MMIFNEQPSLLKPFLTHKQSHLPSPDATYKINLIGFISCQKTTSRSFIIPDFNPAKEFNLVSTNDSLTKKLILIYLKCTLYPSLKHVKRHYIAPKSVQNETQVIYKNVCKIFWRIISVTYLLNIQSFEQLTKYCSIHHPNKKSKTHTENHSRKEKKINLFTLL